MKEYKITTRNGDAVHVHVPDGVHLDISGEVRNVRTFQEYECGAPDCSPIPKGWASEEIKRAAGCNCGHPNCNPPLITR